MKFAGSFVVTKVAGLCGNHVSNRFRISERYSIKRAVIGHHRLIVEIPLVAGLVHFRRKTVLDTDGVFVLPEIVVDCGAVQA